MSELYRIDEINLDRSYEYSVITTNPITSENNNNQPNYIYYFDPNNERRNNENNYVKTTNLDLNITVSSIESNNNAGASVSNFNEKRAPSKASTILNKKANSYGDNLLSNTINQLDKDQLCSKSYFEKLPPEIEISFNGTETLPENSVLETENAFNTSGTETDTTDMNIKRNKKFR